MLKRKTQRMFYYVSHQTSQDARDLATAFLLHECVKHFTSAIGGGQRGLCLFNLLPHVPDHSLGLSILLSNLLQFLLILHTHTHTQLDCTLKSKSAINFSSQLSCKYNTLCTYLLKVLPTLGYFDFQLFDGSSSVSECVSSSL